MFAGYTVSRIVPHGKEAELSIFDKAKEVLNSNADKVEEISDKILDKGEQLAAEKLGSDKAAKASEVRDAIDAKIGNEGKTAPQADPADTTVPTTDPEGK